MTSPPPSFGVRVKNTFLDCDDEDDELVMMKLLSRRRVRSCGPPIRRRSSVGTLPVLELADGNRMRRARTVAHPKISDGESDSDESEEDDSDSESSTASDDMDSCSKTPRKGGRSPFGLGFSTRLRVKNTFVDMDDDQDELAMLKASSRRRIVSWCGRRRSSAAESLKLQQCSDAMPAEDLSTQISSPQFEFCNDAVSISSGGDLPDSASNLTASSTRTCDADEENVGEKQTSAQASRQCSGSVGHDLRAPAHPTMPNETYASRGLVSGTPWSPRPAPTRKRNQERAKGQLWCHIYVNPAMVRRGFGLNKRIIGPGGSRTRAIFEATTAKIRLRGRGSGHIEGDGKEAPAPLMLAVTGTRGKREKFLLAIRMSLELLSNVEREFWKFNSSRGDQVPVLGPSTMFSIGNLSPAARRCVGSVAAQFGLSCPDSVALQQEPIEHLDVATLQPVPRPPPLPTPELPPLSWLSPRGQYPREVDQHFARILDVRQLDRPVFDGNPASCSVRTSSYYGFPQRVVFRA